MRTFKRAIAVALVLLAMSFTSATAQMPDAALSIIAGPGNPSYPFATPVVVMTVGGKLNFTNLDVFIHNVVADDFGTATNCDGVPKSSGGFCPRFWSQDQSAALSSISPLIGVADLRPGTYGFRCTFHSAMFGTLIVLPATP